MEPQNHERQHRKLELFQRLIPRNCHYLTYLEIVPCKTPLARLSIFDLTGSSSAKFLFPGGICQKRLQAGVLSSWLPKVVDNIWNKQKTKNLKRKSED